MLKSTLDKQIQFCLCRQRVGTYQMASLLASYYQNLQDRCQHYKRECLIRAPCCNKFYACRRCHDKNNNHWLDISTIIKVQCLRCLASQTISNSCKECNAIFGGYHCSVCKLHDNNDFGYFHCIYCKCCRTGGRENFFHCSRCGNCIPMYSQKKHQCQSSPSSICSHCQDAQFESFEDFFNPMCGHQIHVYCYQLLIQRKGKFHCPACNHNSRASNVSEEDDPLMPINEPEDAATLPLSKVCRIPIEPDEDGQALHHDHHYFQNYYQEHDLLYYSGNSHWDQVGLSFNPPIETAAIDEFSRTVNYSPMPIDQGRCNQLALPDVPYQPDTNSLPISRCGARRTSRNPKRSMRRGRQNLLAQPDVPYQPDTNMAPTKSLPVARCGTYRMSRNTKSTMGRGRGNQLALPDAPFQADDVATPANSLPVTRCGTYRMPRNPKRPMGRGRKNQLALPDAQFQSDTNMAPTNSLPVVRCGTSRTPSKANLLNLPDGHPTDMYSVDSYTDATYEDFGNSNYPEIPTAHGAVNFNQHVQPNHQRWHNGPNLNMSTEVFQVAKYDFYTMPDSSTMTMVRGASYHHAFQNHQHWPNLDMMSADVKSVANYEFWTMPGSSTMPGGPIRMPMVLGARSHQALPNHQHWPNPNNASAHVQPIPNYGVHAVSGSSTMLMAHGPNNQLVLSNHTYWSSLSHPTSMSFRPLDSGITHPGIVATAKCSTCNMINDISPDRQPGCSWCNSNV